MHLDEYLSALDDKRASYRVHTDQATGEVTVQEIKLGDNRKFAVLSVAVFRKDGSPALTVDETSLL